MFEGERLLTLAPKYDPACAGQGSTHGYHLAHEHNLVPVVTSHGSFDGAPGAPAPAVQGDGVTQTSAFNKGNTISTNEGWGDGAVTWC